MAKKTDGFLVMFFDPIDGMRALYGADSDCEGAIQYTDDAPILFPTRAAAQKAIRISRRFALLQKEIGKPENTDFTTDRKKLRIVKVVCP